MGICQVGMEILSLHQSDNKLFALSLERQPKPDPSQMVLGEGRRFITVQTLVQSWVDTTIILQLQFCQDQNMEIGSL